MTSIVSGEFCTFRHIKTRKAFVIEVEFPEEQGQEVLRVLGMPIGGESKHVAVALLDKSVISKMESANNAQSNYPEKPDSSEGDNLRVRAVMLCKDREFQIFLESLDKEIIVFNESHARKFLLNYCNITSRSSLAINVIAQNLFKNLLERYKDWQFENQYSDNLNRS